MSDRHLFRLGDLTDRLAMLGDVRARVSLKKRDLVSLVLCGHGSVP